LPKKRNEPRPLGLEAGRFTVGDAFDEPLPDDLLDAFSGQASGGAGKK
jgi:hypothetical protein